MSPSSEVHAHARIKKHRHAAAGQHPALLQSLPERRCAIRLAPSTTADNPTLRIPKHFVLGVDKVCYVGEGVAAVVAEAAIRRATRSI